MWLFTFLLQNQCMFIYPRDIKHQYYKWTSLCGDSHLAKPWSFGHVLLVLFAFVHARKRVWNRIHLCPGTLIIPYYIPQPILTMQVTYFLVMLLDGLLIELTFIGECRLMITFDTCINTSSYSMAFISYLRASWSSRHAHWKLFGSDHVVLRAPFHVWLQETLVCEVGVPSQQNVPSSALTSSSCFLTASSFFACSSARAVLWAAIEGGG